MYDKSAQTSGAGIPCAVQKSEVEIARDYSFAAFERLEKEIAVLHDRLTPVLREDFPTTEVKGEDGKNKMIEPCSIARAFNSNGAKATLLADQIQHLMDRLGI